MNTNEWIMLYACMDDDTISEQTKSKIREDTSYAQTGKDSSVQKEDAIPNKQGNRNDE